MKYLSLILILVAHQSWAMNDDEYLAMIEMEAQVAEVQERTEWQTWQQSSVANHFMRKINRVDPSLYEQYQNLPKKYQVAILKAFEKGASMGDIRFMIMGRQQLFVGR